jgi:hypothetical protein
MREIMSMLDLAELTPDHFSPHTGEVFRITPPGGECLEMPLWKVRISSHKVPRGFRQQFSVQFEPPPGIAPPQGLCLVEHETMGAMELFMTPIVAGTGCHYEAVFG